MGQNEVTLTVKVNDDGSFSLIAKEAKGASKAVDGVTASTQKLDKSRKSYHKTEKGVAGAGANTTKNFSKMKQGMTGSSGLVAAYATLAANVFAVTAAFGALKRAAAYEQLEKGIISVGAASGRNLPKVAKSLVDITDAAISTKEAMTAVALGTSAGFSTKQMEGLTKVAKGASLALGRDMADAMSRLTRGAAKLEPEILDELGIMVRLDDATKNYAQSLNKNVNELTQFERRMAFTNAIIEQGTQKFGAIAEAIDANPYDKLSATFDDLLVNVLKVVNVGLKPLVSILSASPSALLAILTFFSATIVSKVVPSLGTLASSSAEAAAKSHAAWQQSFGKTQKIAEATVTNLRSKLSKWGDTVPLGAKKFEDAMRKGTLSQKEYLVVLEKMKNSEKTRADNIKRGGTTQKKWDDIHIAKKEKELALLRKQKAEVIALMAAEKSRAAVAGQAKTGDMKLRAKSINSKLASTGLSAMADKGILDSWDILKKRVAASGKVIKTTTGISAKFTAQLGRAALAGKLFGNVLLKMIPFVGWLITAYTTLTMVLDMFGIKLFDTEDAFDKATEGFSNFKDVGAQLAVSLANAEKDTDKFMVTLNASVGIMDQVESALISVSGVKFTKLEEELNKATFAVNKLGAEIKELEEKASKSNFFMKMVYEIMAGHKKLQQIDQEGLEGKLQEDLENTAVVTKDVTAQVDAMRASMAGAGLDNSFLTSYADEVEKILTKYADTTGIENQQKMAAEIGLVDERWKSVNETLKGGAALMTAVNQAQDAYFQKQDGPLQGIIDKWAALKDSYATIAATGNAMAMQTFEANTGVTGEEIATQLALYTRINEVLVTNAATVQVHQEKMRTLSETMKLSQADTLAFYEEEEALINAKLEKINAELELLEGVADKQAERTALEAKATKAAESRTSKTIRDQKYAEAGLNLEKQGATQRLKSLQLQQQALTLQSKQLSMLAEERDIINSIAQERAILDSFATGSGGEISAQKELELFLEQKDERMEMIEAESEMKIGTIDMEYALLEARLKVAEIEAKAAVNKMPEGADKSKAIADLKAFEQMSKALKKSNAEAKKLVAMTKKLQQIKVVTKQVQLTAAASKEFADGLKKSISIIEDKGIQQVFNSMIDGYTGVTNIMDAMAAKRVQVAKDTADREVQIEKLKQQQLEANQQGRFSDVKKLGEKILGIEAKNAADGESLTKSEGKSKLAMAQTVASGTAGLLEGLAATQDTTSKSGFESAKMMQMGAAVINTAGAIAGAMADTPGEIGTRLAAGAAAAAAGAIQIATIASTTFGGGGGGAPKVSGVGGGKGSSTAGRVTPLDTYKGQEQAKGAGEAVSIPALLRLASASDDAALAVTRVADGFTSIKEKFKSDTDVSVNRLKDVMKDVEAKYRRKSKLGFQLSDDKMNFKANRGSGEIASLVMPAINDVLADVRREVSEAAAALNLEIDMSKVEIELGYWSKRMGSNAKGHTESFQRLVTQYANAVAATIPDIENWKDYRQGDFTEIMRMVKSLQVVNEAFKAVGVEANKLSSTLAGADIADNLVTLLGGPEKFAESMELYADAVLTEAQRLDGIIANAQDEIGYQAGIVNAYIDEQGSAFLQQFKMSSEMDQSDFKALFESLTGLLEGNYSSQAQTILQGLMQALPDFDLLWQSQEERADTSAGKEQEFVDRTADLLEAQGKSYEALSLRRKQEIAELTRIGDVEGARIQRLIDIQEDVNTRRELDVALLRAQGKETEALNVEREFHLLGLKEENKAVQEAIWAAELKRDQDQLNIQLMRLQGDELGALAAEREIELASIDSSLHATKEAIWAQELKNQQTDLDIELMKASGNSMGALALEREKELSLMDESLRDTQKAIWAQELANQKSDMQITLMKLEGNALGALELERQKELATLDESLHNLQEKIWAQEKANEEEAKAKELAEQRAGMEVELMRLQGNATGALALEREIEKKGIDQSLWLLQEKIWAQEDANEAEAKALAIAEQKSDMQLTLMKLQGDAEGALALEREKELAALDVSLHSLQWQIWAQEELNKVQKEAEKIASRKLKMEIQLMKLEGDTVGAVAAQRQLELDGLDESLHALQWKIWLQEEANAAQKEADKLAEQRLGMQIELMKLQGDAEGALALEREKELAGMDATLHALQNQIWAQEEANAEAEKLAAIAEQRSGMQITLMRLQGDAEGALALEREKELAAMDSTLHALQNQIWAQEEANAETERLAAIAEQRSGMQIELMKLQGDVEGALALEREKALSTMDSTLHALQNQIWAQEEANAEAERLAAIEQQLAAIEEQRSGMAIKLMKLEGNALGALALEREKELSALDESLRGLQEQIWAQEHLNEVIDLELKLMKASGLSAQALVIERNKELSAMDSLSASIQAATWEMEDSERALKEAFKQRSQDYSDNFKTIADTYTEQINKSKESIGSLSGAIQALTQHAQSQEQVSRSVILRTIMQVRALTSEVKAGEFGGLENLQSYISVLGGDNKQFYGSFLDYRRDQVLANNALNDLKGSATTQLTTEEQMLATLEAQLEVEQNSKDTQLKLWEEELNQLLGINTSIMSVEAALTRFYAAQDVSADILSGGVIAGSLMGEEIMPTLTTPMPNLTGGANEAFGDSTLPQETSDTTALEEQITQLRAELGAAQFQIAKNTGETTKLLNRWDGDGMPEVRVTEVV